MRLPLFLLAPLALAACASSQGDSYGSYMAQREAELAGGAPEGVISGPAVSSSSLDGVPAAQTYSAAPTAPVPTYPAQTSSASSSQAEAPRAAVFAGISDEQSFSAVSSRETIESDKARIERNRANYQVIAPTALPQRRGGMGPNIVEYALQTNNPVGQPLYSRVNPLRGSLNARNCAKYASPDLAQQAFLEAGGPDRDRHSLDPDGDGYACSWDPAPFRKVLR